MNRDVNEATNIIEEMTSNIYQWPMERHSARRVTSIIDDRVDLVAQFTLLKCEFEQKDKM